MTREFFDECNCTWFDRDAAILLGEGSDGTKLYFSRLGNFIYAPPDTRPDVMEPHHVIEWLYDDRDGVPMVWNDFPPTVQEIIDKTLAELER